MEGAAIAESSRAGRKAYSCECIGACRRPVHRSDLTPPGIPCRSRKVKVSWVTLPPAELGLTRTCSAIDIRCAGSVGGEPSHASGLPMGFPSRARWMLRRIIREFCTVSARRSSLSSRGLNLSLLLSSPSSASFDPRPSSVAGPSVPASPAQVVDIPHTVALAEQFDHSILNDASEPIPSPNPAPPTSRRRAYPFADVRRRAAGRAADGMVTDALMAALPGRSAWSLRRLGSACD